MKKILLNLFFSKTLFKIKLCLERLAENKCLVKNEHRYKMNLMLNYLNYSRKNAVKLCYSKIKEPQLCSLARTKGMEDQKKLFLLKNFFIKINEMMLNALRNLKQNKIQENAEEVKNNVIYFFNNVIEKKNHNVKKNSLIKLISN